MYSVFLSVCLDFFDDVVGLCFSWYFGAEGGFVLLVWVGLVVLAFCMLLFLV